MLIKESFYDYLINELTYCLESAQKPIPFYSTSKGARIDIAL